MRQETFNAASTMRTYPTAKLAGFKDTIMGRTGLEWTLDTECKCENGQYRLKEFSVTLGTVIYMRESFANSIAKWDTLKAENQHVRDFNQWMKSAKKEAAALEGNLQANVYSSEVDCVAQNKYEMLNLLNFGAYDATQASWRKWDESGKHSYAPPGN